jgi:hypothetical protein
MHRTESISPPLKYCFLVEAVDYYLFIFKGGGCRAVAENKVLSSASDEWSGIPALTFPQPQLRLPLPLPLPLHP